LLQIVASQFFYVLANLRFEGWKIIFKVWPFLPSNRRFDTVKNENLASDGVSRRLSRQCKFDARVALSLVRRLPPVTLLELFESPIVCKKILVLCSLHKQLLLLSSSFLLLPLFLFLLVT